MTAPAIRPTRPGGTRRAGRQIERRAGCPLATSVGSRTAPLNPYLPCRPGAPRDASERQPQLVHAMDHQSEPARASREVDQRLTRMLSDHATTVPRSPRFHGVHTLTSDFLLPDLVALLLKTAALPSLGRLGSRSACRHLVGSSSWGTYRRRPGGMIEAGARTERQVEPSLE